MLMVHCLVWRLSLTHSTRLSLVFVLCYFSERVESQHYIHVYFDIQVFNT